jgi:hypothetical protein
MLHLTRTCMCVCSKKQAGDAMAVTAIDRPPAPHNKGTYIYASDAACAILQLVPHLLCVSVVTQHVLAQADHSV